MNFKIRWFQTPRFVLLVDGLKAHLEFTLVDCLGPNHRVCDSALAINHSHMTCNPQLVMDRPNASTRRANIKSVGNLFKRLSFFVCTSHSHGQHRRNTILEPPISTGIVRSHLLSSQLCNEQWAGWNGSEEGHTEVMPPFGRVESLQGIT
jgi:hypothetical protein